MEIQTLKSNLLNLIEETTEDEIGLKSFVQKYLDKKDLTSYFELKHVVNMLQMTTVNKQLSLIINTIKWSLPSGEAINSLCSNLVSSSKNLSPELHCEALKEFENCLCIDNPQYVKLPGNRDSCLQVQTTNVGMTGVRSFTASIWIKVESDCSPMGFLLFHCAGKKNSIQVHFADRQADGSWKVILRAERQSAASSSSTAAHAVEVDGRINFALGEWHHFVLKHDESNRIAFLVDGALEVTRDLPYQFTHASEYRWIFGQGLKGGLATICFYSEALSLPVLQLLYSLGPHTKSVATGVVSVPQSSFDSGHTILGTKISKGVSAHKMCRLPVMFNITASHLIEGANLPQFPLGRLNVDYTEMSPRSSAVTNFLSPNITGGCRVTLPNSWVDAWLDAGGCAVILYLINHYCSLANTEVETDGVETKSSESMGCVKRGLSLLTQLVRQSAEAKEQFIQTHGFHLLSHSLAQLTHKGFQLDLDMINLCCDLLPALGADARNGDGVAAALQGLLFDFRVWGEASLEVRMHHMFRLVDLTSERGEELEKSIGVQRILDILRLHVLRQDYSLGRQADFEGIQVACAEAGYSLLTIATDSGLALLNRNISNVNYVITDIEALLAGVEETNSCLLTERILRVLLKFRDMAPTVFNDVIGRHRYAETTAVSLLSRKGYSAEIHRETIALVLWSLVRECQLDAAMVLQLRRTLVCPILPIEEVIMAGKRRVKRVKMLPPAEAKRIADGVETIKNAMRAAHRAWNSMSMLAILIARAISEGFWNSSLAFSNTTFVVGKSVMDSEDRVPVALTPEEETYRKKIIQEVLSVFHNNGPFGGRPDFWMVLPLLPPLLSHCDLSIYQQILMSFVVSLKTDEAQVETICNLPDRGWTKILIDLAVIGEHYSFRVSSKLTGALGRVEDIGTEEKLSHQEGIAVTCTELALDAAATMLEHKIRFHDQDAWSCWSCLQNCIKTSSAAFRSRGAAIEKQLVKRCLALIFQRLARSNDPWNAGMLNFLENVLMLIANKGLCGQEQIPYTAPDLGSPFPPNATDTTVPAGSSLDDTSPSSKMIDSQNPQRLSLQDRTLSLRPLSAQPVPQSREEQQLLLFVIDLVACLRRVATKHTMFGRELAVLRISLNIALGCLRVANEISAEKLSCEIMNNVAYLSRPTSISMGTEEYKQYIVQIFTRIESVCKDQALDGVIRGRYHALIYRLCHFFGDLRHSAVKSEDGEEPVPSYVLPTLDALSGIENQHDVEVIFEIFRVSLIFSDTVAFDSLDVSDSEMAQIGASPSGVVSSSDEAINKSTHDTADLLSLDEHTETLPAAQFPIAGTSTSCDSPLPEDSQHSHSSNPSVDSNRDREWVSPSALSLMTSVKDPQYPTWVRIRGGIVTDRVDSERLRLSQCMQSLDMNTAAVEKHWSKLQRKVESESFLLSHPCQWKLGVAHEGAFPGRKRLVLRPRFDFTLTSAQHHLEEAEGSDDPLNRSYISRVNEGDDGEQVKRALATACAGYIQDVARMVDEEPVSVDILSDISAPTSATKMAQTPGILGDNWGVIGADGSEDGFGVIGLATGNEFGDEQDIPTRREDPNMEPSKGNADAVAQGDSTSKAPSMPAQIDMNGDLRLVEEAMTQGRRIDTGPCYTGTRRMSHGPPLISSRVILVTASGNYWGTLSLAPKDVYFISSFEKTDWSGQDSAAVSVSHKLRVRRRRWTVSSISAVYLRRYRLRETAIEVFFRRGKHRHFFVDFGHTKEDTKMRLNFARALMEAAPASAFKQWPLMSPFRLVSEHKIQDRWLRGEMSNFEYLMALNTISGRSFNDLCQYPVMPWVLSDYSSASIDLNDPAVYRNLSKPMGALNETRLQDFLERYNSFAENETIQYIPPFMYGSHYSTMVGVVLHFLIRLQPFASLHKEMQGGRFDVADRLFASIPVAYLHNTTQLSEVKELTPEWFTTPEMFRNVNNFEFGVTQDGDRVGDVQLPPWASTPEEFVLINRQALESEFVSAHLHEWIDLIFGYKQVGPAAVEACNVFYYLTYAGSVDRQLIKDEALRQAVELQIAHFGQIPQQLFRTPHPARQSSTTRSSSILPRSLRKCFPVLINKSIAPVPPFSLSASPYQGSRPASVDVSVVPASFTPSRSIPTKTPMPTQFTPATTDEEEIAAICKCSMINRRNPGLTLRRSTNSVDQGGILGRRPSIGEPSASARPQRAQTSNASGLAVGNILTFMISTERIIAVIDSGVVEVYKYAASDAAKNAIVLSTNAKAKARRRVGFDAGDRRSVASVAFASDPDIISFDDYSLSSTPMTSTPSGKLDFVLSDWREPIVTIEKDNTHFEALPRIPLAAASIVAPSPGLDGPSATLRNQLPSNVRQVQACARLVHFSRSGNLLFSAGHVDGSVYVREIETRTGFIASAGDFLGHRHRVVSIASDFISGSNTDVVASCDSFGQVLVWTVSQSINPTTGKSYIISRRPQRMFRCPASQNTCLDISWQMGIVAVACRDSVRVFSVEREQLLHNISVSSLFFPSEIADDLISPTRNERSNTFSFATDTLGLGRSRSGSIALKSATVGSRSESPIRPSLTEDLENRSLSVDGMFKFDSTLDEGAPLDATKSEATSAPASAFRTRSQTNASITSIPNLDFDIDGADADAFDLSESRLSILHVTLCNDGIIILHVKFRKDDNTVGDALVSISLSGYLTGRVVLPGKLSYIDCASRGDVVLTGFEDGRVSLFTSQELRPLYSFLPWQDAACVYATYPTAISLVPTGATVLCVRVGPNEAAPAVLCVSTTMGELYVKPLPDFIRWERGRTPSALAQIVNAPLQAVRGTIQQATSLGAWTTEQANALAHNAKSFADETLSEMLSKTKFLASVGSFFGVKTDDDK